MNKPTYDLNTTQAALYLALMKDLEFSREQTHELKAEIDKLIPNIGWLLRRVQQLEQRVAELEAMEADGK